MAKCRYVLTDDVREAVRRREPIELCGAPIWRGSYCRTHWERCYRPATRREVKSFAELEEVAEAA
ncbi:MAG: hypothetical protein WD470_10710, partial [Rhodospirillaceae bacterium]